MHEPNICLFTLQSSKFTRTISCIKSLFKKKLSLYFENASNDKFYGIFQLDVVVFAHLAQIYFIDKEVSYSLRDFMTESCPNLVGLVNRMKERCFSDWDDICTTLDLNSHLPKPAPEESKDNKEDGKDEKEGDKEKEPEEKDIEKEKVHVKSF